MLLNEVLALPSSRSNVRQLRFIVRTPKDGGTNAWRAFDLSGPMFIVTEGPPADVTVVRSYTEAKYIHTVADLLASPDGRSGRDDLDSSLFVAGKCFSAFPAPWHSTSSDGCRLATRSRRVLGA